MRHLRHVRTVKRRIAAAGISPEVHANLHPNLKKLRKHFVVVQLGGGGARAVLQTGLPMLERFLLQA